MEQRTANFWKNYIEADELEQSKMLDSLPIFQHKDKTGLFLAYVSKSSIKSYFDDIIEYFKTKESLYHKVKRGK